MDFFSVVFAYPVSPEARGNALTGFQSLMHLTDNPQILLKSKNFMSQVM
jgi:hypothetical protein